MSTSVPVSVLQGAMPSETADDARRALGVRFVVAALLTSLLNLVLNAAAYVLILKDVYRAYPAGSEEFVRQLHRPADQLVTWAMVVTSLAMGLFITTVMSWSGARTVTSGLARGAIVGVLFWTAVNSGLYASSNLFSLSAVLADTPCSALCMTISGAFAAWMLRPRQADRRLT